jgi:hypothetical protein
VRGIYHLAGALGRQPFAECKCFCVQVLSASLDFPKLMQDYLKHDGCLLISDDPNLVEIADNFELIGKPVWRSLAEVPRTAG